MWYVTIVNVAEKRVQSFNGLNITECVKNELYFITPVEVYESKAGLVRLFVLPSTLLTPPFKVPPKI